MIYNINTQTAIMSVILFLGTVNYLEEAWRVEAATIFHVLALVLVVMGISGEIDATVSEILLPFSPKSILIDIRWSHFILF